MELEFLPLLQVQLDLYRMPRGKDHLRPFLENLLAMGAEQAGAEAMARAASHLSAEPGKYRANWAILRWDCRQASQLYAGSV